MKMADAAPLLNRVSPLPIPPFLLNDKVYAVLGEKPPLDGNVAQPLRMTYLLMLHGYSLIRPSIMDTRKETTERRIDASDSRTSRV